LSVNIGKKDDQLLADTYQVNFNYHQSILSPDYFSIDLNAEDGPLSTQNYRIQIEATPLKDGKIFIHFSYAYAFGLTGRLAMQGCLATIARDKVGFTVAQQANGKNAYIKAYVAWWNAIPCATT